VSAGVVNNTTHQSQQGKCSRDRELCPFPPKTALAAYGTPRLHAASSTERQAPTLLLSLRYAISHYWKDK